MDFVTAVSHELRTPLTVISSAADNIAQGVVHGKEQLTQYGSVIGNQVRQLSALVEQVLLFAATNHGQQRLTLRPLEVSEIVDATLSSTEGLIGAAQFTVERDVAPDLPPVMGDLLALSQWLQNLITNALKYGREQRWLGIRATAVDQGLPGKEVQISVSDRGMGISDTRSAPHLRAVLSQPVGDGGADSRHRSGTDAGQANGGGDERPADRDQRARKREHVHVAPALRRSGAQAGRDRIAAQPG